MTPRTQTQPLDYPRMWRRLRDLHPPPLRRPDLLEIGPGWETYRIATERRSTG